VVFYIWHKSCKPTLQTEIEYVCRSVSFGQLVRKIPFRQNVVTSKAGQVVQTRFKWKDAKNRY